MSSRATHTPSSNTACSLLQPVYPRLQLFKLYLILVIANLQFVHLYGQHYILHVQCSHQTLSS